MQPGFKWGKIMDYQNLAEMFFHKKESHSTHTAYMYKKQGIWYTVSYREAVEQAEKIAAGLSRLGIGANHTVALISRNRLEWALIDYAVMNLGAILVPIYPTLLGKHVQFILEDSGARVLFAEDASQMEKVEEIRSRLTRTTHFFLLEPEETRSASWNTFEQLLQEGENVLKTDSAIAHRYRAVSPEDTATIIYTSGTTGLPKGVELTHKNFLSNIESVNYVFRARPDDVALSFLPLSHILERMAGHFFATYHGLTIAYAESINQLPENMREVRPTLMVSVPRLYEKMYARIMEVREESSPLKRKIFDWAVGVGQKSFRKERAGEKLSVFLRKKRKLADKLVFRKIREQMGGRIQYCVSGGAPLGADIGEFFAAVGIPILEGYGLTETSPAITFNRPGQMKFGTVGQPLPGVEVKIAEDGEILTRGEHVMKGYFQNPQATAEAIDSRGWFHTGDIGYLDDEGNLVITDRKKNLIVTSGGKNVAPQPIENKLISSKYIDQAVVIGDKRKFCSALLVPNREIVSHWAREQGIEEDNYRNLLMHPAVQSLFRRVVDHLMTDFAGYEQVKKFLLIPEPFTMENGELTPTLKIKRRVIEEKFAAEINALYQDEEIPVSESRA